MVLRRYIPEKQRRGLVGLIQHLERSPRSCPRQCSGCLDLDLGSLTHPNLQVTYGLANHVP